MRKKSVINKLLAFITVLAVTGGELAGTGITLYAAQDGMVAAEEAYDVRAAEDAADDGAEDAVPDTEAGADDGVEEAEAENAEAENAEDMSEADGSREEDYVQNEPQMGKVEKVAWETGIAVIRNYCPYGNLFVPLLNALGALNDSGPTMQDVSNEINNVSKEVSAVSGQLTEFRKEMGTKLDALQKDMSGEINTALNKVKNEIFINGVGSELDTLHAQLNDKNGIASKVDTINKNTRLSDQAKAIEIAYLIGSDKEWDEMQNALYRFNNLSDLLAGMTYRDTKGRNLYQVLYNNAAMDSMFTGEAYDRIDPYIERVMYEYWYDYSVIVQCLSAHLVVSQMTEAEAKALGAAEYNKYKKCRTYTSLVKDELDGINSDLYDSKSASSIISLYSTFKYKQEQDRLVFINKGKTEIAVAPEFDKISNDWTGKRNTGRATGGAVGAENLADDPKYKPYYQGQVDFVSGSTHLAPAYIKGVYEHVKSLSSSMSFYDYLKDIGFDVEKQRGNSKAYFATGDMKKKVYGDYYHYDRHAEFGFDTFDPKAAGDTSREEVFFKLDTDHVSEIYYIQKHAGGKKYKKTRFYIAVFVSRLDASFLGIKKTSRAQMPETAWGLEHWDDTYTLSLSTTHEGDFEACEPYPWKDTNWYGKNQFPVTIKDKNGNTVSRDYTLEAKEKDGVYFDDTYANVHFLPGTYHLRARMSSEAGRYFYSDWLTVNSVENHQSSIIVRSSANQKPVIRSDDMEVFSTDAAYSLVSDLIIDGDGTDVFTINTTYSLADNTMLQSKETSFDGIRIYNNYGDSDESGKVIFTKPGTFHIRAKLPGSDGGYTYSDWQEVRAKDPENCLTMFFYDTDGSVLHKIIAPEGTAIDSLGVVTDTDWNEEDEEDEEEEEEEEDPFIKKENHILTGWDLLEADGNPDGKAEEIPESMPGEDTSYYAMWERTLKDGYVTAGDAQALIKAVSEAPAAQTTKIALMDDMTVDRLSFPRASDAAIVIDGMEHTLTFTGNASIAPKNKQSLALEDITLKAEKNGRAGDVTVTASAGGLTLDGVDFECRQATVRASKGALNLKNVFFWKQPEKVSIKGGSKSELNVNGTVWAGPVTGFKKVTIHGLLIPYKTLKAGELKLESDGRLNVMKGAVINISRGISGTGTVYLDDGFTPITLGSGNSGCIMLVSDEPLQEHSMIFKGRGTGPGSVFDISGISPKVTDGSYKYGLYSKGGKTYLRAYRIKLGSRTYCEWGDCIADINKGKAASDRTMTLLGGYDISGALKLPSKGKCGRLTINGDGHRLTFNGGKATAGCDITFRNMTVRSVCGSWTLNKGRFEVACDNASLIGCTVK